MCGIAGILSDTKKAMPKICLDGMLSALAHRGPDDTGRYLGKGIAIGHKRLSIVDLEGGHQPIISKAGNVLAVNGMIYNFVELKQDNPGYPYQTRSDSEAVLMLYEKHGPEFTQYLRGMYAIALYDPDKDRLILARDSFGIKPLYYAIAGDRLIFASQPQALFAQGQVKPLLHAEKAAELLQLKFVTSRQTVFDGVLRVLPGETLVFKGTKLAEDFRRDAFKSRGAGPVSQKTAFKELDKRLSETVSNYVRSDVPYGVFLSGGVDSCSIVAAMARAGQTGFPCYTARFPGSDLHDETRTAAAAAKMAGAEHISLSIEPDDFWDNLPELIGHMDDPSMDPAMMANYLLARRAAQDVKVILGGDGGDEIFGGYRRYERALLPKFIKTKPLRARGVFSGSGLLNQDDDAWRRDFAKSETHAREKTRTRLQAFQATDGADFLPHFHLTKLDRCLMAHGIEGRTPLLDEDLAEFGFNLPDRLKLKRGKGKLLLRQWLNEALPAAQPFAKKRGFSTPVNFWIKSRAPEFAGFVCDQPGTRAMFDIDAVRNVFENPDGKSGKFLWPVLFFALWHERHIIGRRFTDMGQLSGG